MNQTVAELLIVRHGETDWNHERRLQGHIDTPLNAVGRDQAQALAEDLRAEYGETAPPIYTSDLRRAKDTARIVGRALGVTPQSTPKLRERMLGLVEGKTWDELAETHPDEVRAYRSRVDRDAIPGIELMAAFRQRVLRAVRGVAKRSDRAIVVTHGGVLRVLLEEAEGPGKLCMISNASRFRFRVAGSEIERVVSSRCD